MTHIYHQIWYGAEQQIEWYQIKKSIHKITINRSSEDMIFEKKDDSDSVFLLDERYFDLVRCPIQGMIYEPMTIEQLSSLIDNKVKEIKKTHRLQSEMIMYDNENIIIDGEPSHFLLWKTGYIQRDLLLIYIKPSLALSCPTLFKNLPAPRLYPSSYFTLQFMSKSLHIPSFLILTLSEHTMKLIRVQDGFYDCIETLDRGIKHLKQILVSNNVIQYFNKDEKAISQNPMARSVMVEAIRFYNKIVCDWIQEYNNHTTTCIINTPAFKNNIFMDTFMEDYQAQLNGYIVPSSVHNQLNQYKRTRQMSEIDVLTYLNFADSKELI